MIPERTLPNHSINKVVLLLEVRNHLEKMVSEYRTPQTFLDRVNQVSKSHYEAVNQTFYG